MPSEISLRATWHACHINRINETQTNEFWFSCTTTYQQPDTAKHERLSTTKILDVRKVYKPDLGSRRTKNMEIIKPSKTVLTLSCRAVSRIKKFDRCRRKERKSTERKEKQMHRKGCKREKGRVMVSPFRTPVPTAMPAKGTVLALLGDVVWRHSILYRFIYGSKWWN